MSGDQPPVRCQSIPLHLVNEERGFLLAGEVSDHVPFPVQRFFVVGAVPNGEVRGGHAHRRGEQLLVAVSGSLVVDAWYADDHERHVLQASGPALQVPPGTFTCQSQFSQGALLLVLCSDSYDPADYIEAEEFFAGGNDPAPDNATPQPVGTGGSRG